MTVTGQASYAVLFELLREAPETTRTEMVRTSGLSKATVSEAVAHMIARGLLVEIGKRQPGRGRSQVILAFQPQIRLVIGAQFTESGCHAVLADLRAGPVAWADRPLPGSDPADFVEALAACVDELRQAAQAPILGLGVGVPGLVDPSGREVVVSVPHGWQHVPIRDMLEERLGLPVIATNRAKAAALGEYWQGDHRRDGERDHLAYIYVGAGIVAGFVTDGKLYVGAGGSAGELGHTTILPDGPACACGNRGCLETIAADKAILASIARDGGPFLTSIGEAALLAREGNEKARAAFARAGEALGCALAMLANIVNPSRVVLSGEGVVASDLMMDHLAEALDRHTFANFAGIPEIVTRPLSDEMWAKGAAVNALRHVIGKPLTRRAARPETVAKA